MHALRVFTGMVVGIGVLALPALAQPRAPVANTLTYQGVLKDAGAPANGSYDLRFQLFDDAVAGVQQGPTVCAENVDVSDGLFTVTLNFGDVYANTALWMAIGVRADATPGNCGAGVYTTIAPRQAVTLTPFSAYSLDTDLLDGQSGAFFQNASNLNAGTIADARLSSNVMLLNNAQTVTGVKTFATDVNITDDQSSITFPAADATNAPMIQMFAGGTTNGTRMLIGHGPSNPTWGIEYDDSTDQFHFRNSATRWLSVDLNNGHVGVNRTGPIGAERFSVDGLSRFENGGVIIDGPFSSANNALTIYTITTGDALNVWNDGTGRAIEATGPCHINSGDLSFGSDDSSITFPAADATNSPMINMFTSGTTNGARTVIAHSPGFADWGLAYTDSSDDFDFIADGTSRVKIDLNGSSGAFLVVDGTARVDVLEIVGADVAEKFPVSDGGQKVEPGHVVAIDTARPGQLCLASDAYSTRVAGVVSGANGLPAGTILGNLPGCENSVPIALSGRVWCWCDATGAPIAAGDLLTTSDTPGHAMKSADRDRSHGAVLGKAMTKLREGRGMVLVLVNLQ